MKETLFKQTWWVSLAVVLAALQVVFAVGAGTDSDETAIGRGIFFALWTAGSVLVLLGTRFRVENRRRGNALISLGVLPAVATGIIAFWFPPMWLATAAGLAVIAFAVRDAAKPVGVASG